MPRHTVPMNHSTTSASSAVVPVVPVVSVRGSARIECPPDLAVLTVSVTAKARTRESATESLVTRVAEVRAVVDALDAALERCEQGPVSVWPEYRDGSTERVERYVGAVSLTVEINDFAVLPDLVGRLNAGDLVQLSGPWWRLRPENPAYREARVAAASDALARAHEYAGAFGVELVDLLEVADQGMSTEASSMSGHPGVSLMAKSMDSVAMDLDFSPQPQEVFGSLEARFSMTRAQLERGPHR